MKALNSLAHSRRFTLGCLPSPHLSFFLLPPAAQICSERHLKQLTVLRSGPGWPLSPPALPFLSLPSSPLLTNPASGHSHCPAVLNVLLLPRGAPGLRPKLGSCLPAAALAGDQGSDLPRNQLHPLGPCPSAVSNPKIRIWHLGAA